MFELNGIMGNLSRVNPGLLVFLNVVSYFTSCQSFLWSWFLRYLLWTKTEWGFYVELKINWTPGRSRRSMSSFSNHREVLYFVSPLIPTVWPVNVCGDDVTVGAGPVCKYTLLFQLHKLTTWCELQVHLLIYVLGLKTFILTALHH